MTATRTLQRRAGAREWAGLAVLAVPCLLVSMDAHVLNLAIPRLSADLRDWAADITGTAIGVSVFAAWRLARPR